MKKSKLSSKFQSRTEFFSPKKIYLINKKKREKKKRKISAKMCSTIPNLCSTSSLIFQPVGENSFEEKSWTGLGGSTLNVDPVPRFTPKNMTRIFPPLTHPHFIYSPAGRLVSIQHRRSINFEFFIRRSPAQPRFFQPDLTPFLSRGRARKGDRCRDAIAIPLSRGFVLKKIKLLLQGLKR